MGTQDNVSFLPPLRIHEKLKLAVSQEEGDAGEMTDRHRQS